MFLTTTFKLSNLGRDFPIKIGNNHPVFDYCDVVWDNLDQGLATRIQKLQNRAARIITFQGYDVRSAQIRKQLNWEELASRRQRHLSLLMYDTCSCTVFTSVSIRLSCKEVM
ncbi:unnamed protein product [Porites evermanni]|uniref:Uncharacterized protein n=2 Tax=Porites TaxID=46719 RepID=A0ABN8Q9Z8_9CNID|nr:unnamed protein product [Porites lobata]CAH3158245.1 unnamed protein product [Porites evermanni]CAH3159803.1 unnamed protein product [Porites evermanni]